MLLSPFRLLSRSHPPAPGRGRRPGLAGLALVSVAAAACGRAQEHLVMDEIFAHGLPDSIPVGGVAGGPPGQTLVWAPGHDRVWLLDGAAPRALAHPELQQPVGAGFRPRGGRGGPGAEVEVVDGASGSIVRFAPSGEPLEARQVREFAGAVASIRAGRGWFAVVEEADSARGFTVRYRADRDGRVRTVHRLPPRPGAARNPPRVSAWGERLILTDPWGSFESVAVDPRGGGTRRVARPRGVSRLGDPRARWQSMPVLPVGPGFLQVLADVNSDERVFVLYDRRGAVLRTTAVRAPLALVAERTAPDALLGVRRAGRTEVVGYRWRWVE